MRQIRYAWFALAVVWGMSILMGAAVLAAQPAVTGLGVTQTGQTMLLEGQQVNHWGHWRHDQSPSQDVRLTGSFKILKASERFSPRVSYWPLNYHYLVNEPGYDFAIFAQSESTEAYYRIQFSTRWNEIALWKEGEPGVDPEAPMLPTGFFAVVKSNAGIQLNQVYQFELKIIGNKLQLLLNGRPVLAYEDTVLPLETGGWGASVFHGAQVEVTGLRNEPAQGRIVVPPVKRPNFSVRQWHRGNGEAKVVFDGDEPIAAQFHGTAAWLTDVKLRPGYRPQIAWPMVYENKIRSSAWQDLAATPDQVTGTVAASRKAAEALDGKTTLKLTYDAATHSYQYLVDVDITLKQDNSESNIISRNSIYYLNTYPYNSMRTIEDGMAINFENWATSSSPYRAGLVKGHDGKVYRWPIHHFYGSFIRPGFSGGSYWQNWENFKLAQDSFMVMYPEKVICPTVDTIPVAGQNTEHVYDSCNQYWDMHFWSKPAEGTEFKAGYNWKGQFRVRGMPAAEADKLAGESELLPSFDPAIQRPYYVEGLNRFDQGGNVEETASRLIFEGRAKWDKQVGRDDQRSLRMENTGTSHVFIGYNGASAEAKKVRISLWVKSDGPWTGEGVRIGIDGRNRFGGTDRQWGPYVQPVPGQWTEVVYDVPFPTYNVVCVWFQTQGQGTVWLDDFEYQRLEK